MREPDRIYELANVISLRPQAVESSPMWKSAKQLMTVQFDPIRFAVEGIILEGLGILAGRPKIGKSWLLLQILLDIAAGRQVLGVWTAKKGEVLYYAMEDTERRLQDRIRTLHGSSEWPEDLHFIAGGPRSDQGGLNVITEWLMAHPTSRAVAIDTWGRFRSPSKSSRNVFEADYEAIAQMKQLAEKHRVAIVLVHHLAKGRGRGGDWLEGVSGSMGVTAAADSVMVLDAARGEVDAKLRVTGRDIIEQDFALNKDPPPAWRVVGIAAEFEGRKWENRVLKALADAVVALRPAELYGPAGASSSSEKAKVRHALSRLLSSGTLAHHLGKYSLRS